MAFQLFTLLWRMFFHIFQIIHGNNLPGTSGQLGWPTGAISNDHLFSATGHLDHRAVQSGSVTEAKRRWSCQSSITYSNLRSHMNERQTYISVMGWPSSSRDSPPSLTHQPRTLCSFTLSMSRSISGSWEFGTLDGPGYKLLVHKSQESKFPKLLRVESWVFGRPAFRLKDVDLFVLRAWIWSFSDCNSSFSDCNSCVDWTVAK